MSILKPHFKTCNKIQLLTDQIHFSDTTEKISSMYDKQKHSSFRQKSDNSIKILLEKFQFCNKKRNLKIFIFRIYVSFNHHYKWKIFKSSLHKGKALHYESLIGIRLKVKLIKRPGDIGSITIDSDSVTSIKSSFID